MAKQLNVSLNVAANTSGARSQIQELQSLLHSISTGTSINVDAASMAKASAAAQELSVHLNNAYNATTGNFDLSKLDRSLKASGQNIQDLSRNLLQAGSAGEQAFAKLARSIAVADRPLMAMNAKLKQFSTTLMNTARWQLSSSMLHGFIGAISSAYGYAKDLNESLNNIRIVTGMSVDQMSKFAEEANKAAKALSTTTTAYTDAALIYYQQGDSTAEVIEKANITVKMANVVGQSAETVSDQLTAIWNNFDNGTKSLEYYADAITALGAATASSTDEIAQGLEKFASVADTVGLSYEYATAALATVTAQTRQSADVVGTAFKTLFARLSDLKLGETLDDGTTLGTYTANLAKVGVNIKTTSGELKDMDTILDETAEKWKNLDRDQQVALAKGVAGIRQYSQFIALMDNWDFMEQNLDTIAMSGGTLSNQAAIYAESWDAASKRVRASAEAIYDSLLDDEFFISVSNGFSGLLDSVNAFIDGIGGVGGVVTMISSLLMSHFAGKIGPAISGLAHNFMVMFQSAQKQASGLAAQMNEVVEETLRWDSARKQGGESGFSEVTTASLQGSLAINKAKSQLTVIEKDLTALEKQRYNMQLNMIAAQQDEVETIAARIDKLKEEKQAILDKSGTTELSQFGQETDRVAGKEVTSAVSSAKQDVDTARAAEDPAAIQEAANAYMQARQAAEQYKQTQESLIQATGEVDNTFRQFGDSLDLSNPQSQLDMLSTSIKDNFGTALNDLSSRLEQNKAAIDSNDASFVSFRNQIDLAVASMPAAVRESEAMQNALATLFTAENSNDLEVALNQIKSALQNSTITAEQFEETLKDINPKRLLQLKENAAKTEKQLKKLKAAQEAVNKAVKQFNPKHQLSGLEALTKGAAGLSSLAMAAQSVRSIFNAWSNDDLSFGEKLTTSLISLGMVIPMLRTGFTSLLSVGQGLVGLMGTQLVAAAQQEILSTVAQSSAKWQYISSLSAEELQKKYLITADQAQLIIATAKLMALNTETLAIKNLNTAEGQALLTKKAKQLADKVGITTEQAAIIIKAISTGKTKEEAMAEAGLTATKGKGILAGIANIGIKITEAIARKANKVATDSETKSLWAETAAKIASQAAAWPMLVVTLLLVAAIGILVAIIWAVVAAFQAFAANSPEGQLKAAEETAAELSTALETAKQKAEDLKAAFDSYDEVTQKLAECEKGTREWTEALQAVNSEVLDLIKQYPELTTMVNENGEAAISYGDSGEMVIADWAREELLNAANEDVLVAQAASIEGNQNVRKKQIAIKEDDFVDAASAAAGYTNTGVAKLIKDNAEEMSKMTRDEQKAFLEKLMTDNNMMTYYDSEGYAHTDNVDRWMGVLDEVSSEFGDLTTALNENTAAIDAENRAIAASALSDNSIVQNSALSEDVLNVSGHLYEQLSSQALQDLKNSGWGTDGISKATGVNDEAEKIFAEYAEAAGITGAKLTDTTGTDKNRKFVYTDANGEEVTVSLDAMRLTKAAYDAMGQLDGAAQQLTSKFEHLANSADLGDHALQNFLANQNFYQSTGTEVADISADVEAAGGVEAYLDQMIGDGNGDLSDMTAQKYGFEDAASMVEAYEKELAKVEEKWQEVEATIPDTLNGIRNISLASAQELANDYKEIASGPGGDEAVEAFTERLQYLEGQMSPEKYQEFMEQIGDVDWSNWNAMEDVQAIIDSLGISLDLTGAEWDDFADKMRTAAAANPAEHFNNIRNNLSGLGDAIKGVNPGDLIDETQYQSLIALNEDLADSFIQTADGYKYIGTEQIDVKDLGLEDDLKEMNEASRVFNNAKDSYNKSSISKMASSTFDTTDYAAEADKLEGEIDSKFAAKEKELGKGWGGGWYGDDDKAKAAEYKKGLEEEVAQKRKQQEEADARNAQLQEDLKGMGNEILADESLMEVAKAMNYDEAMIQEMIDSGNYEGLQKLAKNVDTYMQEGLAGAYDSTELQEKMAATATNVNELNQMMYDGLITDTEVYQKQLTALTMDGIINAQNLQELQDAMSMGGNYSYDLVADALIRLGEQYDNCSQEIDAFNQALDSGNAELIASAQESLEASIMIGEAAEKYGFDADEMEVQAAAMAKAYGLSEKAAAKLAIENQRMNKGVASLSENWGDWKKELSKSDKTTTDYAKAAAALTSTIADLVGASEDLELSPEFLEAPENLALIEKAAQGDIDAINQLGIAVAAESVKMMQLGADITTTLENGVTKTISVEDFNAKKKQVLDGINDLQNQVASGAIKVGDAVNAMDGDWISSLNDMALATNMSVEEMNALLSELGVETEVTTVTKTLPRKIPVYTTEMTNVKYDDHNNIIGYDMTTRQTGTQTMDETIEVAQIGSGDNAGTPPKITYIGNGSVAPSSTGGGGGGGGDKSKADTVKKKDTVDRYKEVTDNIDKTTRAMDAASNAADRLYGSARIAQMEKVNSLLQEEIRLNGEKRKEALEYLNADKSALNKAASEAGISFTYDEAGNISNYTEEMTKLHNELDAAITKANADGNADEDEQKIIDDIQAKIDAVKDAQADYEETLEVLREIDQNVMDKFNEWQDNNFEIFNAKIEVEIELNDREMALLEYQLGKIEDDVYATAEAISLIWGGDNKTQMDIHMENMSTYKESVTELTDMYNKGEISHASFIEGLQSSQDNILSELESLQELDATMQEYYSETLSAANEEISRYTELIDGATTALEHFSTMMELLGKQSDYEAMGIILAAQAEVAEDKYNVSAQTYDMFFKQAQDKKKAYEDALAGGSVGEYGLKQLENEWLAAEQAAQEAQDQMLSDAEAWAESLGAILDNALAGFAQELEDALTGEFGSFELLSTQMERANSLQEEYLTTTNKIYETNKMMRNAQKEIDKTTNAMAKQKLKQFINETAAMQEQGELSQYELDIQQAKYDLLLAEIALKEAQNAKSTVRLQRDSEGNFGYVYTANQQAVSDAQQKFEDAQNALYNKGLEGANDYAQKSAELQQEYADTMAEIFEKYRNGEYQNDAEYHAAQEAAQEYYYEQLQSYSRLYQVATTTDSRVVADAWSSDFAAMVTDTENWKKKTETYVSNVSGAFSQWSNKMKTIREQTVGKDLTELASKTALLAQNSDALATKLLSENGVIDALEQELNLVGQVTTAYGLQRDALMAMVAEYEEYLRLLGIEIETQSNRTDVIETGMEVTVKANTKNWSKTDSGTVGSVLANGKYKVLAYTDNEVQISNSAGSTGWVKKTDLVGFDTGGYTGSWGSYGKLAMLHEKEMVLNKQDTENLLASMEFLNHILEIIDLQALSNQLGGILAMPSLNHNNAETIEQNVHIEASFPGVSDRNEIEEAFNNLINTASQYANRR